MCLGLSKIVCIEHCLLNIGTHLQTDKQLRVSYHMETTNVIVVGRALKSEGPALEFESQLSSASSWSCDNMSLL